MARFGIEAADNYGSSSSGNFFSLTNDKDTARVRFLYGGAEDICGDAVHKIQMGVRKDGSPNERYVNCLREYNEPLDNCPFCKAQLKVVPRFFIKLYNEDTGECQIWDRSKSYLQKLGSLSARYNPLYNKIVEIERNGAAGDKNTEYMFYPLDDVAPIDINDEKYNCPDPVGSIVLDKSYEDMEVYLETGSFPEGSEKVAQARTINNDLPFTPQRRTPGATPTRRQSF